MQWEVWGAGRAKVSMGWIQGQAEQEECTELHFTDIIICVCSLIF